jgi:GlpG protein
LRQIGTLPAESGARLLADYLLTLGVTTRIREESEGWGVWVLDEDRLARARQEFEAFRNNPDDPRFQAAPRTAETIRRESERLDSQYRKNFRLVSSSWSGPQLRRRPLTIGLIAACVAVYLLMNWSRKADLQVIDALAFSGLRVQMADGQIHLEPGGIEDILHGQVWRLITPIFLHFNPIHLLFDMWALSFFGSLIEYRRDTRTLALLVFLTAIASNVGQHLYNISFVGHPVNFGGMSGVVYGLFGYVWMKGQYEPEQGMILHPSSVQMMLFWLVICMFGFIGNVANAAHAVGLVAGILCGLARL